MPKDSPFPSRGEAHDATFGVDFKSECRTNLMSGKILRACFEGDFRVEGDMDDAMTVTCVLLCDEEKLKLLFSITRDML